MNFSLQPLNSSEFDEAYSTFKKYMYPVIDSAIGWDEDFQQSGFTKRLQPEWFYWITNNNQKMGLLCYRKKEASIHIHLLIIFEAFQGAGMGYEVTKHIIAKAKEKEMPVTLGCFKNNQAALKLYQKLGFQVTSEDELFYDFIK